MESWIASGGGWLRRALIGALFLWALTACFIYSQFANTGVPPYNARDLRHIESQLEWEARVAALEQRNQQLERELDTLLSAQLQPQKAVVQEKNVHGNTGSDESTGGKLEVELRTLQNHVWELFYYARSVMMRKDLASFVHFEEHWSHLTALLDNITTVASRTRETKLRETTKLLQQAIHDIQHPADCTKDKLLVCTLNKGCGFGCQLHHAAYCAIVAFSSNRTMIFQGDGRAWRYSQNGWNGVFEPISHCTQSHISSSEKAVTWGDVGADEARVLSLPIVDALGHRPAQLPLAFPAQLAPVLLQHHSNPPVYFISQFLWYLMRPHGDLKKHLDTAVSLVGFEKGPVVGVQVRRTDKVGTEAARHELSEYMEWVERWFRIEEQKLGTVLKRRVLVATDEPAVVEEAKTKWSTWEIHADASAAASAAVATRYSDAALAGVITDIWLLSHAQYLVCTFSSQVCRMGYELAQVRNADTGVQFHSLDDLYYYGGQHPHEVDVIIEHNPENEQQIELKIGDVVGIAGNHWDGWSRGENRRTRKVGLFPSYKAKERWRTESFPPLDHLLQHHDAL